MKGDFMATTTMGSSYHGEQRVRSAIGNTIWIAAAILAALAIMLIMKPAYAPSGANETTRFSDTTTTSTTMNRSGNPELGITDRITGATTLGPHANTGINADTDEGLTTSGPANQNRRTVETNSTTDKNVNP